MDRYQKVEKPRQETPIDENEIRITSQGRMRSYITYAMTLLQEKGSKEIVFKAMGRAINKTVTIVELIKRRIIGLHQITSIGSTDITDTWEPLEEGLLPLETTRHVSMITITLSKEELNTSAVGYQPPLPAEQVKMSPEFDYEGEGSPTNRGRGRGGRGRGRPRAVSGNGFVEFEDGGWDRPRGYARGRGRNFRGRGRGGYNGPQLDTQQDVGVYNQEAPVQGRGNGFVEFEDGGWDRPRGYARGRGRGRNFRGRGRGGYNGPQLDTQQDVGVYNQEAPVQGQGNGFVEFEDGGWDRPRDYARGRGRGRNFHGRGRGGYNGPQMDAQQDVGVYNQEAPVQDRGNGFVEFEDGGWDRPRGYARGRGRGRNFRGRGRGGYNGPQLDAQQDVGVYNQEAPVQGRGNGFVEFEDGGWERPRDYARGRGRGRNFHGRGRGGYNGPQMDAQQDVGVYNQEAPVQDRGSGRGRGSRGFKSNRPNHVASGDA